MSYNQREMPASSSTCRVLDHSLAPLFNRRRFGMSPGLERMKHLLAGLGNPHHRLASIHIAGTNGKGSVAAMLASILHAAGYPAGRFTSPHLIRFNERFVCREQTATDADLAPIVQKVERIACQIEGDTGDPPTFFECATAIAMVLFVEQSLPIGVIETGLGGRLDATNVLLPAIAIITRIGLDHTQWLGDTIEAIAAEKAGIIKTGRPVVRGAMPSTAADIIDRTAARQGARCFATEALVNVQILHADWDGQLLRISTPMREIGRVRLPLSGVFQAENAATAVAACEILQSHAGIEITDSAIRNGLSAVKWSGRLQCVSKTPPIIIDGAHNPDAAHALSKAWRQLAPGHQAGLVLGMCEDKDAQSIMHALIPGVQRAWTVPTPSARCLDPEILRRGLSGHRIKAETASFAQAIAEARAWAGEEPDRLVLVCGSLFLAGQALAHIEAANRPGPVAYTDMHPNESLNPKPRSSTP